MFVFNIKRWLKKLDLFGQPIQLSFNHSSLQKSFFGGINTFLLLVLIFYVSFQGLFDVFSRTNITSFSRDNYELNPPYVDLSPKYMTWAISYDPTTLNVWGNKKYFTIQVFQVTTTRDQKGNTNKKKTKRELIPCELQYFNPSTHESLLGLTSDISSLLCPKIDDQYFAQGKYSSSNFSYINFKIVPCVNSTNGTCASQSEINKAFKDNSNQIMFQIFFVNNIININDLKNTINSFIDDRIYISINLNLYKEMNYYFTQNKIFTDRSIITTDYKEEFTTFTYENDHDTMEFDLDRTDYNDIVYCSLYFRSNFITKYHQRTFDKIGKLVSYVGGFWSIFFLIFSILGKKYNKHRLFIKMSNELYDFSNEIYEAKQNLKTHLSEKNQNIQTKTSFRSKIQPIKEGEEKNNDFFLKFKGFLDKKTLKLQKSIKYMFNLDWLFKKTTEQHQNVLKKKAFFELNKELDIANLLKSVKEIEKLKIMLLNEKQRNLFDFPQKTVISTKEPMLESTSRFKKRLNLMGMSKNTRKKEKIKQTFNDIKKAYEVYIEMKNDDAKNEEFNRKILSFLDESLLRAFSDLSKNEKHQDIYQETEKMESSIFNGISLNHKSLHKISKAKLKKKTLNI